MSEVPPPAALQRWRPSPPCTASQERVFEPKSSKSKSSPVRPEPGIGPQHCTSQDEPEINSTRLSGVFPDGQGRQAWPQTLSFAASRRFCGLGRGWALIDIWASVGLPVSTATHCEDKVRKQYQWLGWGSQLHVAVVS